MSLTLELPVEVETKLRQEAAARGITLEDYAMECLRSTEKSEIERNLQGLEEIVALGARLTHGTLQLSDDAVARSYEASA